MQDIDIVKEIITLIGGHYDPTTDDCVEEGRDILTPKIRAAIVTHINVTIKLWYHADVNIDDELHDIFGLRNPGQKIVDEWDDGLDSKIGWSTQDFADNFEQFYKFLKDGCRPNAGIDTEERLAKRRARVESLYGSFVTTLSTGEISKGTGLTKSNPDIFTMGSYADGPSIKIGNYTFIYNPYPIIGDLDSLCEWRTLIMGGMLSARRWPGYDFGARCYIFGTKNDQFTPYSTYVFNMLYERVTDSSCPVGPLPHTSKTGPSAQAVVKKTFPRRWPKYLKDITKEDIINEMLSILGKNDIVRESVRGIDFSKKYQAITCPTTPAGVEESTGDDNDDSNFLEDSLKIIINELDITLDLPGRELQHTLDIAGRGGGVDNTSTNSPSSIEAKIKATGGGDDGIASRAIQEFKNYGGADSDEGTDPLKSRIKKHYYPYVGKSSSADPTKNYNAWSAAFVSFVAQDTSIRSTAHKDYMMSAKRTRNRAGIKDLKNAANAAKNNYYAFLPNEKKPMPGDICCRSRTQGNNGWDSIGAENHCDIYVGNGKVIGGNLSDGILKQSYASNDYSMIISKGAEIETGSKNISEHLKGTLSILLNELEYTVDLGGRGDAGGIELGGRGASSDNSKSSKSSKSASSSNLSCTLTKGYKDADLQNVSSLSVSAAGIRDIKKREGSRSRVYDDKTGKTISSYADLMGNPTIGVGHLITPGERSEFSKYLGGESGRDMSSETISALFKRDISTHLSWKRRINVHITQNMFDALADYAFNAGPAAAVQDGIIALINQKKYTKAFEKMCVSRTLNGRLAKRRREVGEAALA